MDPAAAILAISAQRRLLDGARLDGPVEPDEPGRRSGPRRHRRHRIRRVTAGLLIRIGRALEPAPACPVREGNSAAA